jgi:hypothetical protein
LIFGALSIKISTEREKGRGTRGWGEGEKTGKWENENGRMGRVWQSLFLQLMLLGVVKPKMKDETQRHKITKDTKGR